MFFPQLCSLMAVAFAVAQAQKPNICTDTGAPPCGNVFVLAARGNDPGYHDGNNPNNPNYDDIGGDLIDIAQQIINHAPNSNGSCRALRYGAAVCGVGFNPYDCTPYFDSLVQGSDIAKNYIRDFHARCPSTKIVLIGYSQGAQTLITTLVGERVTANQYSPYYCPAYNRPALNSSLNSAISGAVLFASPSFVPFVSPVDFGDAGNSPGGTAHKDPTLYNNLNTIFGNRVRSYCQAHDFFCDNSKEFNDIHDKAVGHFKSDALTFLRSLNLA